MSHSEVMKWFEYYFPDYAGERIDVFFPNGRNSIRIRQKMVRNLYSLTTVKRMEIRNDYQFLNGMKGGKK